MWQSRLGTVIWLGTAVASGVVFSFLLFFIRPAMPTAFGQTTGPLPSIVPFPQTTASPSSTPCPSATPPSAPTPLPSTVPQASGSPAPTPSPLPEGFPNIDPGHGPQVADDGWEVTDFPDPAAQLPLQILHEHPLEIEICSPNGGFAIVLRRPGEPHVMGSPTQPGLEITDTLALAPENGPELGGEGVALGSSNICNSRIGP